MANRSRYPTFILANFVMCIFLIGINGAKHDRTENEIKEHISTQPTEETTTTTGYTEKPQPKGFHGNNKKPIPKTFHSTPKTNDNKVDAMDQFLLDGLLNIVDEKFSTLNKRLLAVERGIQNMQYYSVRNFRVVNTHLHAVDNLLHGIHTEIDTVQGEQKEIEQSIKGVKKEVVDIQSLNGDMFQAIEQNLVHFHEDMQSRIAELKEGLDQSNTNIDDVRNDTLVIKDSVSELIKVQQTIVQNTEAAVILSSHNTEIISSVKNTTEKVLDTSDKTHSSVRTLEQSVTSVADITVTLQTELETFLTNFTSIPNLTSDLDNTEAVEKMTRFEHKETKQPTPQHQLSCNRMLQLIEEKMKHINVTVNTNQNHATNEIDKSVVSGLKSQNRKLLRALSTVNDNIYQSVTLYKHTGNLIERVISDTELVASEQVQLREELVAFLLNGTLNLFNHTYPDITEFLNFSASPSKLQSNDRNCANIEQPSSIDSQNTTELVNILTNLASSSAISLNSSLGKLDEEIGRLNKLQEDTVNAYAANKADLYARDDPKVGNSGQLYEMANKTEMIFTIVEAIASNTGFIPYLFHSMRFVEAHLNKTLKQMTDVSAKTDDVIIAQRANKAILLKQSSSRSKQNTASAQAMSSLSAILEGSDRQLIEESSNATYIVAKKMTFVYEMSQKLNRLIPALSNLLGEPEPYIALVNGKTDREGRVEIYHKGVWGTIAQNLGHIEASYICRKLGYLGGISAGNGHFGAGSGSFWNLNVTCLQTRWCESVGHVTYEEDYSHDYDAGVICDHMVRLVPPDAEEDSNRNAGRLEIYHKNNWFPVCFKGWGRQETSIACKQLGFREGAATAMKNDSLVDVHWMTKVTCNGKESRLDACKHKFEPNGCPDFRHVSVICS